MLNLFAQSLRRRAWQRHLLFVALTLATVGLLGYHYGTFDQVIHIPFLKKFVDPSLYPNDLFFETRWQHYSYFWFLLEPFYRWSELAFQVALFVGHLLSTYLTFWALWDLSDELFHNPLASLLGVCAFVTPHFGFSGFPVLEFSLLNRTFVLPFLLWAVTLYLRRRYWSAYLVLGLLYNLHVISAGFVVCMFVLSGLLEFRRVGWRNTVVGGMLFVLGALPVLLWRLGGPRVSQLAPAGWFEAISQGMLYHLFHLLAPYPYIWIMTVGGVSTLILFLLARRSAPDPARGTITAFVTAVMVIVGIQIVATQWLPLTLIFQTQILRAGVFLVIFAYLFFANHLARLHQSGALARFDLGVLAAALVVSITPLLLLVAWLAQRFVRTAALRRAAVIGMLAGCLAAAFVFAREYQLWLPGVYITGRQTSWYDVQVWARENTPQDARFITPPEIWWLYESDWRVFSERSTLVTFSELLEVALVPEYLPTWQERFDRLAPGARAQFGGDYFRNRVITRAAFRSLSTADLLAIARDPRYHSDYLVAEKPCDYDLPLVYDDNPVYAVYDLR